MAPEWRMVVPGGWSIVVAAHAAMVAIAVGVGLWWAGHGVRPALPVRLLAAWVAVVALAASHAAFTLLRDGMPAVGWSGGLASMGGIAGGLAAAWVGARVARLDLAGVLDAIVPAGLLALGLGRVGCFLGGCCYGGTTDLPWGVVFPDVDSLPRHPLQLYSAGADLLIVVASRRTGGPPGRRARVVLTWFAVARVLLETLRDPATTDRLVGAITLPQVACVILLLAVQGTTRDTS